MHDTDDPQFMAIQGTTLTDADALRDVGEVPCHETVVLLPRSLSESYPGTVVHLRHGCLCQVRQGQRG